MTGTPCAAPTSTATLASSLHDEVEAAQWLDEEVRSNHPIPVLEAETIVHSLSVAMHAEQRVMLPLDRAITSLRKRAGAEFDPQFVEPLVAMMTETAEMGVGAPG